MKQNNYIYSDLTGRIIGCAIEVHRVLGPGLLEKAYEECLTYELQKAGLPVSVQKPVPVVYKEIKLDHGYRIVIMVNDLVIIEIKSVESLNPVHEAQMLTYLRFADKEVGLLINFNVALLKSGIRKFILSKKIDHPIDDLTD